MCVNVCVGVSVNVCECTCTFVNYQFNYIQSIPVAN